MGRPCSLSLEDRARVVAMHMSGVSNGKIASIIGCDYKVIHRYVTALTSTTAIARAHLEAGADVLAKRVVEKANVVESLETLDRLDVLPRKRDVGGGQQFTIHIGMPGHSLPVPTDAEVAYALAHPTQSDGTFSTGNQAFQKDVSRTETPSPQAALPPGQDS